MAKFAWVVLSLLLAGGDAFASQNEIGKIVKVQGKVFVTKPGGPRSLASRDRLLYEGESVTTGPNSKAVIRLGTDIAFMVNENTEVTPKRYGKDWVLSMGGGSVLSTVRNPEKRPNHFVLRTKSAVLGVRGTTFFVQDMPSHPLYLCLCEGKLIVRSTDGKSSAEISGAHHDSPIVIESGLGPIKDRIKSVRAKMMRWQHTDAEVEELEHTF